MYEISQVDSSGSKPISYFIEKFSTLPFLVLSVYWAEITKKLKLRSFRFLSMENRYFLSYTNSYSVWVTYTKLTERITFHSFHSRALFSLQIPLYQWYLFFYPDNFDYNSISHSIKRLKVVSRIEIDLNQSVFFYRSSLRTMVFLVSKREKLDVKCENRQIKPNLVYY